MRIAENTNLLKLSLVSFFLELYFISPVVVLFFMQRGLTLFQVLLLEAAQVCVTLLLNVPLGIAADRYGRKRIIFSGSLIYTLAYYLMMIAYSFAGFLASFLIFGIAMAFLSSTMESLIYEDLKMKGVEGAMKRAMGHFGFFTILASVISPPVGSWIARDMKPETFNLLILSSLISTVIAAVITLTVKEVPVMRGVHENPFRIMRYGLRLLRRDRSLRRVVLLNIFTNPFYVIIMYLFQPYFIASGNRVASFGIIFSIAFSCAALSQRYAWKVEQVLGVRTAGFLMTFMPGAIYTAMAFVSHRIASPVLFVLLWLFMGLREPLFSQYINMHIQSDIRTAMLSFISFLATLYLIVARIFIGSITDRGHGLSFVIMGALIMGSSLIFMIRRAGLNRMTGMPD